MGSERLDFPSPSDLDFPSAGGRRLTKWVVPLALVGVFVLGYPYLAELVRAPLLRLFPAEGLTLAQALTVIFGGPVALFLIILTHEAGHALAGVRAGLRFRMMAAGPFWIRVSATDQGRQLKTGLHLLPTLLAGYSVCVPPGLMPRDQLRRAMLWHIAGGPCASLALGSLSLAAGVFMQVDGGWASVLRAILLLTGLGNLLVGVATATPTRGRSLLNDGARWLQLARGGERADRDLTLLSTSARAMAGEPPRDWDRGQLESAARISDASLFAFWALRYLWVHQWDCDNTDDASATLRRALNVALTLGQSVRAQAALDASRFSLWACDAPENAAAWIQHSGEAKAATSFLPPTDDSEAAVERFYEARASESRPTR